MQSIFHGKGRQDLPFAPSLTLTLTLTLTLHSISRSFSMGYLGKEGYCFVSEGVLSAISSSPVISPLDLSFCHQCGLRLVARLQTFHSQWRIVLLCRKCFVSVNSGESCSYCFSLFTELDNGFLDCKACSRRVHSACIPLHHRNFSQSRIDVVRFVCIDCCPIPNKASGCSTSRTSFTMSMEDLVKGGKCVSEKKVALKGKGRKNIMKKVMIAGDFAGIETGKFDAVQLVEEPSCLNLPLSGDKMAVPLHHRAIHESHKISQNLGPKGVGGFTVTKKEQWSCDAVVRDVDYSSCANHGKTEDNTVNKSLLNVRCNSVSMCSSCPNFEPESVDLMKHVKYCNTCCLGDLALKGIEGSSKFPDSTDNVSNIDYPMLPCYSLNTQLNNANLLSKYWFGNCGGEGHSKMKRKGIEAIDSERFMKKYFRKRWGPGRTVQSNSHSILNNSPLYEQDNWDLMKKTSISIYNLNTCPNSRTPQIKYLFCDGDGVGSSKIQQSSLYATVSNRILKKYFRKRWGSGGIVRAKSQSFFTNKKHKNGDLMKQNRGFNIASPMNSLKEKVSSMLPDSTDDVSNTSSGLLPFYNLKTCSYNTIPIKNCIFGVRDAMGSSKTQHISIDAVGDRSMKKYFRRHCGSGKNMQRSSQYNLNNGPLFKQENEDLMNQMRGCKAGCPGDCSLKQKLSSLKFSDSNSDDCNNGSTLLSCVSTSQNSTMLVTKNKVDGIGGGFYNIQRRSIDSVVYRPMKKYFRQQRGCGRNVQGNSLSVLTNSSLFKKKDDDLLKQMRECDTGWQGDFFFNEKVGPLKFSSCTDHPFLPCHDWNTLLYSTMPLTKYIFSNVDGDRERFSEVRLKSIDAIGSGTSMKKYYRRSFGSRRITQGNSQSISASGPLFKHENGDLMIQGKRCSICCTVTFSLKEEMISLNFTDSADDESNSGSSLLPCDSRILD